MADEALSRRQLEILLLLAQGRLAKQIALEIGISVKTVDSHRTMLYTKLGAKNAANAVWIAKERGLI